MECFGSFLANCCNHLFWTVPYIWRWIIRAWSRECYTHDISRWFLWLYSHHHPTKSITLCNIGWFGITEKIRRWRCLAINVHDRSWLFFSSDIIVTNSLAHKACVIRIYSISVTNLLDLERNFDMFGQNS